MSKRVYELGEPSYLISKEINATMKAKEYIKMREGEDFWDVTYINICNSIREQYNFNYIILIEIPNDINNKEDFRIIVFEVESDDKKYNCHYDEEKDLYYIEVED